MKKNLLINKLKEKNSNIKIFKKLYFQFRKNFKYSKLTYDLIFFFFNIPSNYIDKYSLHIFIRVLQNNIFITFFNFKTKKIIKKISCGLIQLKSSKKKIKFNLNIILNKINFLIKKYFFFIKNIILKITAPRYFKKIIYKFFFFSINYNINFIYIFSSNKAFNGCRVKKKRRKKRKFFRIFS